MSETHQEHCNPQSCSLWQSVPHLLSLMRPQTRKSWGSRLSWVSPQQPAGAANLEPNASWVQCQSGGLPKGPAHPAMLQRPPSTACLALSQQENPESSGSRRAVASSAQNHSKLLSDLRVTARGLREKQGEEAEGFMTVLTLSQGSLAVRRMACATMGPRPRWAGLCVFLALGAGSRVT